MTALTPRERFRRAPESLLLYAVSDDAWLGERTLASCCAQAVRGGATFLQLRAKRATTKELISAYAEIRDELEREGLAGKVPFVIDDDVEAALAVGADGVHVGQSDESCASARARLGEGAIVGVSAPNRWSKLLPRRLQAPTIWAWGRCSRQQPSPRRPMCLCARCGKYVLP